MFAVAKPDRGTFAATFALAALVIILLSTYAGAYFTLSQPDYSFHEVGVHRTYRTFRSPTLVTIFDPMAKVEGLVTGDKVGLISPREGIAFDAIETGTYLR